MKTLSLPIGQPRIDIKIFDLVGIADYKLYKAKVVGMGGLEMSPMIFPFMRLSISRADFRPTWLAKGFTTPDRIAAAEKEQDYTLLEIDDRVQRELITLEDLERIKSGDLRLGAKSVVTTEIINSGVELRMIVVDYNKLEIHDVGGGERKLVETPLTIRKGDIPYLMRLSRLPAPQPGLFDATWARLSAQMEVKGPEDDQHLVWRPENAAEIREQITSPRGLIDWLYSNDVFGIVVPEPPKPETPPKASKKSRKTAKKATA